MDADNARRLDGDDLLAAVRQAMSGGPILAAARVERAIRETCPEMIGSWAVGYVAGLVASGEVPETEIVEALEKFRRYRSKHQAIGDPLRDPAAYMAAVLVGTLKRRGIPWKNVGANDQGAWAKGSGGTA
jgi:hypothetical protein